MSESEKRQSQNPSGEKAHVGGCHCGAVRFEARFDLSKGGTRCNCTVCTKVASTGVVMKPDAFRLLAGAESLGEYRVGNSPNSRHFCKRCGIHVFGKGHVEVLGGDFVSVNLNCLDDVELSTLPVLYWDGRHDNWSAGPRREPWPVRA